VCSIRKTWTRARIDGFSAEEKQHHTYFRRYGRRQGRRSCGDSAGGQEYLQKAGSEHASSG
jgi:hypothetical protein